MSRAPLFLAREVYRRRRWRDAARMLPVVGGVLLILPLLWRNAGTGPAAVYVFGVWAVLIGGAAVIAPRLAAEGEGQRGIAANPDEDAA